ncbi:DUF2750 domain-containing protein [Acinetobacter sp. WZC-1]|uniref:DUF2750 domain-containing protein n=1 Tax=Acinetobacter sp. WZC-1 TaxID=3459034 RepID=UPI00403DE20D
MRNPYQRKAVSSSSVQKGSTVAHDQYIQFIRQIVAQTKLYALYKDGGWALCATPSGQQTVAVWQSRSLAQLLLKGQWEGYEVQEVALLAFVEKMIPFIRKQHLNLSLNLTPEGQNVLVSGDKLIIDLKKYLYELYASQPALFRNQQLPLPRKIRLHDL